MCYLDSLLLLQAAVFRAQSLWSCLCSTEDQVGRGPCSWGGARALALFHSMTGHGASSVLAQALHFKELFFLPSSSKPFLCLL